MCALDLEYKLNAHILCPRDLDLFHSQNFGPNFLYVTADITWGSNTAELIHTFALSIVTSLAVTSDHPMAK